MESFPRQNARTRRFTIGAPRSFSLSAGGDWITFLQSNSSEDPFNKLWAWSASSGQTKVIADLEALINSGSSETISREELARRERVREIGAGIVSYSANGHSPNIAFASN
ncbi:MAG: S9 family peptidase, partial [Actinomycetota bacterium]|nr:S9 family peptidase [Actinomycetota bacterium]